MTVCTYMYPKHLNLYLSLRETCVTLTALQDGAVGEWVGLCCCGKTRFVNSSSTLHDVGTLPAIQVL